MDQRDPDAFRRLLDKVKLDHSYCPCCGERWYCGYDDAEPQLPFETSRVFKPGKFDVAVLLLNDTVEYGHRGFPANIFEGLSEPLELR